MIGQRRWALLLGFSWVGGVISGCSTDGDTPAEEGGSDPIGKATAFISSTECAPNSVPNDTSAIAWMSFLSPRKYNNPKCYKAVVAEIDTISVLYTRAGGLQNAGIEVRYADSDLTTESACADATVGAYLYRWDGSAWVWVDTQFSTGGLWVNGNTCYPPAVKFDGPTDIKYHKHYRVAATARRPSSNATRVLKIETTEAVDISAPSGCVNAVADSSNILGSTAGDYQLFSRSPYSNAGCENNFVAYLQDIHRPGYQRYLTQFNAVYNGAMPSGDPYAFACTGLSAGIEVYSDNGAIFLNGGNVNDPNIPWARVGRIQAHALIEYSGTPNLPHCIRPWAQVYIPPETHPMVPVTYKIMATARNTDGSPNSVKIQGDCGMIGTLACHAGGTKCWFGYYNGSTDSCQLQPEAPPPAPPAPPPVQPPPPSQTCTIGFVARAHTTWCQSWIASMCADGVGCTPQEAETRALYSLASAVCLGTGPGCCLYNIDQDFNTCGN